MSSRKPWERPQKTNQPPKNSEPQRPGQTPAKKVIPTGRNRGSGNNPPPPGNRGNGGNNNNEPEPSPWLDADHEPIPDSQGRASFVEYLRWMRSPDHKYKDPTKVQILQMAQKGARYGDRLKQLVNRTKRLAATSFQVKCPWRIRVGGTKGPESILLPAFDALGIPYIPSSTLRGVARAQAVREFVSSGMSWQEADLYVAQWFGHLDAQGGDRTGKIVFFDAYPLPNRDGLAIDMANNIWKWEGETLKYKTNPNNFISLKEPEFLIGLKLASGVDDQKLLDKVKRWLIQGLQAGIGSQINSGYGELIIRDEKPRNLSFLRVRFEISGQLIHGYQKIKWNSHKKGWDSESQSEIRPIAFKSSFRYWFRSIALGLLSSQSVKELESKLFGGIEPQDWGWLTFRVGRSKESDPTMQKGILKISLSPSLALKPAKLCSLSEQADDCLKKLTISLAWLVFHLGGIGQGARRPFYERSGNPPIRGCLCQVETCAWETPATIEEFTKSFKKHLEIVRSCLIALAEQESLALQPGSSFNTAPNKWREAFDQDCQIVAVSGRVKHSSSCKAKCFALQILHEQWHPYDSQYKHLLGESKDKNLKDRRQANELSKQANEFLALAKNLCGGTIEDKVNGEPRKSIPSPVWVIDFDHFQVVTVFGATSDPRKEFLQKLEKDAQSYQPLWPL